MRMMEPIDVLAKKEQMEKDCNFKTFMKKPGCVFNGVNAVGFQAASLFSTNLPFDVFCFLLSGYNLMKIYNKWERYKDIYTRLAMELEETPVYSRMCENYFTFVHELAKFLKQFEIQDKKELLCLLELMLKNGYFSYNFNHEYHKYKIDTGEMSGTTGAHVTTGKCVCRHMASFFSDVLHQFNIDGCNVEVRVRYEDEVNDFLKFGKKQEFNHAVVGIVDRDKKFMFDPTNDVFIGKADTRFRGYKFDDVGQTELKEKNAYVFTTASMGLNKLHLEELKKYNKASMEEMDFDRILKLRERALNFYLKHKKAFDEFYTKTLPLLEEVNRDITQLSPKSDDEIKEWVLKY